MKKFLLFIFLLCTLLYKNTYSLTIEVSNPNLRPFKIYLSNQKAKNIELANLLINYLQLLPNLVFVDDIDNADHAISFEKKGDVINIILTFMKTQEVVTFEVKKSDENTNTAIKLADMIFEKITQTRGIFSTNLVFSMNWNGVRQIFLSDISGKRIRKLTDNFTDSVAPKISPQRNLVVYTRYFKTGGTSLRLIDLKNLDDIPIYSSKGLNVAGSFSEDGSKIYFTSYDGKISKIFVYDINKKSIEPIYSSRARLATPVKTHNKSNIAFVSDEYGSPQIFLLNLENKQIRRITHKHSYSTSPSFAPTGTHFVYIALVSGINKIFATSIDGLDFALLTPIEKNFEDPHWSKNERFIFALSKEKNSSSIYLIDISTLKYTKLFTLPAIMSYLYTE